MTHEELLANGNKALVDALSDTIIIINSDGNALAKKYGGDEMEFSPRLECNDSLSTVLFDDEDGAKNTIENVLLPQDPTGEYYAVSITRFQPDDKTVIEIDTDGQPPDGIEDLISSVVNKKSDSDEENTDSDERGDEHEKG